MVERPSDKLTCRGRINHQNQINAMGDKSPKSIQKKSSQKKAKANSADQKKKAAALSKQVAGKNR